MAPILPVSRSGTVGTLQSPAAYALVVHSYLRNPRLMFSDVLDVYVGLAPLFFRILACLLQPQTYSIFSKTYEFFLRPIF